MSRILRRRPSPGFVIACIALFVSMGGVSYGLATGSVDSREIKNNTVRSRDIRNNQVTTRDLRNNSARGRDIRNNTLTGTDINEGSLGEVPNATNADNATNLGGAAANAYRRYDAAVPSGRTITGAFGDIGAPSGNNGGAGNTNVQTFQRQAVSFPVEISSDLTDALVNFAPSAAGGDDDATCTGTAAKPTAPAGKVCLYPTGNYAGATNGTGVGRVVRGTSGASSRFGFQVESNGTAGNFSGFTGVWAYTAP
jgi:hypothetical protein